jgi:hypothetical protein
MAITQTTITKAAGFGRSDVITQLEQGFTWLGWHGSTRTGIVTGISDYSGGGKVGSSNDTYEDVRQSTSTGIGTGASFYVTRSSGNVNMVMVNRPGFGYTNGEYVTLSANDIGGSGNGAVAIGITVSISPVGYGSTNAFYDFDKSGTYPWGVLRNTIQSNKRYGDTYNGFQITSGDASSSFTLNITSGSDFHPWDTTNTSNRGNSFANRFAGRSILDVPLYPLPNSNTYQYNSSSIINSNISDGYGDFTLTGTVGNTYGLDLTIFRSGLDPNFAVLSFRQPTLSSTILSGNTFSTFFLHKFTTNIWDLNELFLGGVTFINPTAGNTGTPTLEFRSFIGGSVFFSFGAYSSVRCAEFGYIQSNSSSGESLSGATILNTDYSSNAYKHSKPDIHPRIYYRNNTLDSVPVGSNSNFNAVIKGIPLNAQMVPCPYYLPDDFVLIDFDYATPAANIQQGDTITISGSEVYTVITGSYNQTTRTRGILFCARTV